jgi:hypothetical protein
MMPKYLIDVKAYRSVIIDASNERAALDIAYDECTSAFDWEVDDCSVENILKNEIDIRTAKASGAVELEDW